MPNKRATIKIYGGGAAWPIGSCIHSSQPAAPGFDFQSGQRLHNVNRTHLLASDYYKKKYRVTKLLLNPKFYAINVETKFLSGAFSTSDAKLGRKSFLLLILKERLGFRKLLWPRRPRKKSASNRKKSFFEVPVKIEKHLKFLLSRLVLFCFGLFVDHFLPDLTWK